LKESNDLKKTVEKWLEYVSSNTNIPLELAHYLEKTEFKMSSVRQIYLLSEYRVLVKEWMTKGAIKEENN